MVRSHGGHNGCKWSTVLYLMTGNELDPPRWLGHRNSHSRARTMMKLGMSIGHVLWNAHGSAIALSGPGIKYQIGDVTCFSEHLWRQSLHSIRAKQPVFIISGGTQLANISAICGCDTSPEPSLHLTGHCLVLVFADWKGCPAVFQFGRCDRAVDAIHRKIQGLELGASDPLVSALVPRSLALFSSAGKGIISVEEKRPGLCPQFSWEIVDAVLDLWLQPGGPKQKCARGNLGDDLERTCRLLPAYSPLLSQAGEKLLKWYGDCRFPGEISHGDLWLKNVLCTEQGVSGIIDWEWARRDGIRAVDAIHLLLMSYAEFRDAHIAEFFRQVWDSSVEDHNLRRRLAALQTRYGLDDVDMKYLALLLWFDYLARDIRRWGIPAEGWHQKLILELAPTIRGFLARHGNAR